MKKILIIFYVLFNTITFNITAQTSCKRVNIIKSKSEKKAMTEYIKICEKKGFLKDKKGIILLEVYKNPGKAQKMWSVTPSLHYGFKGGRPALEYSEFYGYAILISRTDSNNRFVYSTDTVQIKKINDCLKNAIGNKVLPYVQEIKPEPKYFEYKKKDGTTIVVEQKIGITGNYGCDYFIDFYKNGKYKMTPAA